MTLTIEAMMRDGKALQSGTSHYMGTNFAKAFNISFNDVNNQQAFVHTTSWGLSTRFIGALIMTHGDDKGLIMPPRLAPIQVAIIPITRKNDEVSKEKVMSEVKRIQASLKAQGLRVKVDDRDQSPGFKFNEWEMKGVPLRIEIGPKDLEKGVVLLANRLAGEKQEVSLAEITARIPGELEQFHHALLKRAADFRDQHTYEVHSYDELKEKIEHGFVIATHCGDPESEKQIQEETKATVRCIPLEGIRAEGTTCVHTSKPSGYARKVIFAKAY
jgi:prolyl-tRNA synthetase